MAASKRNSRGSGSNAGTVFWLAIIVIVLFIFALNWGKIQETLARTNFHEIVKTQTGSDKPPQVPKAPAAGSQAAPQAAAPQDNGGSPATPGAAATPPSPAGTQVKPAEPVGPARPLAANPAASAAKPVAQSQPDSAPKSAGSGLVSEGGPKAAVPVSAQSPARSRSASLFFVRIDDDGVIVRQETKRLIPASDSPLLDSLAALLKGPSEDELRKKLISLVPQGTKLLSAQVRGSTAVLNFNEAFMYNHYGIEGYAGQLKQIVYTATAFPTVQDVQILIEGAKIDYLGGEGVFIGRPLSRNSF
jgi:spore germination protein GerM